MTREEYLLLYEKLLSGRCTEEEKELLAAYRDDFELEEHPWEEAMGNKEQVRKEISGRLRRQTAPGRGRVARILLKVSAAAAVLALLVIAAARIFFHPFPDTSEKQSAIVAAVVKPGGNKAVLTLANGDVIVLDSSKTGILTSRNGVVVRQSGQGQVAYNSRQAGPGAPAAMNTIATPAGGQYRIVLDDGTTVWLNAASSMRFPVVFGKNERRVEVNGEAYFEVAPEADRPFRVSFNGNTVTVLGTHFDVMAYKDEEKSRVTLLEGSVAVSNQSGRQLLKPGMQALLGDSTSRIATRKANIEEAVAWKNGYFVFDNENIYSIMRKISRWYDVEVVYQGNMTGKEFSGTISRFENVSEVLSMLELTESIHLKLQGRSIRVTP